jgi:regulator of replication initiation timing
MQDISNVEARLEDALARIEAVTGRLGAILAEDEASALRAALDDERLANAQLMERVKVIKERQETQIAELEGKVRRLGRTLATQEATLMKLRGVNDALRANNDALRAANAEGVGNPDLINASMARELDALRQARAADRAEMDEVMGELSALVGGESGNA